MIFLVGIGVSLVFTLVYGLWHRLARRHPALYFLHILLIAVLISPVIGVLQGSFHSHGFDVYWWMYAIVNALVMLLVAALLLAMQRGSSAGSSH